MGRRLSPAVQRPPDRPDRPDHGVTLIEVLIAVAVLSVLAVGASLSVRSGSASGPDGGPNGGGRAAQDQQMFLDHLEDSRRLAVLSRQQLGLSIRPAGLARLERSPAGWRQVAQLGWHGRSEVRVQGRSGAEAFGGVPDIVILPDGQITGFSVGFYGPNGLWGRCTGAGLAEVRCDP